MTLHDLLDRCTRAGIVLQDEGAGVVADAPAGALTPDLRDSLRLHKPVLWRLVAMRRHGYSTMSGSDLPPQATATWPHHGAYGLCCSCPDPLSHPGSYGRCDACQRAAEAYYSELEARAGAGVAF